MRELIVKAIAYALDLSSMYNDPRVERYEEDRKRDKLAYELNKLDDEALFYLHQTIIKQQGENNG